MINKFVAGTVVSALTLAILPANAEDWGQKIEDCAIAAQEQGLAESAEYRLKFLSASKRQLTIRMTPAAGGDPIVAICQISRGKVKGVELKA